MSTRFRYIATSMIAIAYLLSIGNSSRLMAQTINEEVTVTAAFEPSIPDSDKINIEPPENETEVNLPAMTYNNEPAQMMVSLKPESIAAVRLVSEPLKKLYRNYVKAGMGTYTTPFIDLYASSLRSETHSLGIHIKHISSSGEIENHPISSNSHNQIDLYGQKFLDNHTISADLGFRRNVVHHYGFLKEEFNESSLPLAYTYKDDDLKQRFARIHGSFGIKSNYKDNDRINHFGNLRIKNLSDLYETRETTLELRAGADKQFELLDFTDYQQLGLTADVSYVAYKDSLLKQNNTLVSLKPFISTSFNEYTIKAGINLNFKIDTVSKAYLFPFAEGQLRLIDDALVVHAGITGNVKRQGFDELSDINPFLQSVLPLKYMREKFTFYAGLRARAGEYFDFSASVRSSSVANAYFFVNDYNNVPFNRFTLIHDDGNVIKGRLEAQYHTAERINVKAYTEIESWSLDSLNHAFHTPVLKVGVDGMYQIQNKIVFRANVAAHSKQYARILSSTEGFTSSAIDGFLDISLGIEYRYTKVLSAFINFNNLTNSRYYLWNNYPSYRFNLMGGIAYSF